MALSPRAALSRCLTASARASAQDSKVNGRARRCTAAIVAACLAPLCPAVAAGASACAGGECPATSEQSSLLQQRSSSAKSAPDDAGVSWLQAASERGRLRRRSFLEQDMSKLHAAHYAQWMPEEDCDQNILKSWAQLATMAEINEKLSTEEFVAYKARFYEEIMSRCKVDSNIGPYFTLIVREAAESEKPVLYKDLADSINAADIGFHVSTNPMYINVSAVDLRHYTGRRSPNALDNQLSSMYRTNGHRIPGSTVQPLLSDLDSFDTRDKWPQCSMIFSRVGNQGVCGAAWAFAATSVADSRVCIDTNGTFQKVNGQLSRGMVTSCVPESPTAQLYIGNPNGCDGGHSYLAFKAMSDPRSSIGVPTGGLQGCVPYFAHSYGIRHFKDGMNSPPCQDTCTNTNYARSLSADSYHFAHFEPINHIARKQVDDLSRVAKLALMLKGPIVFGLHADGALLGYEDGIFNYDCGKELNHEAVLLGWGKSFFKAMNSWGVGWGEDGYFRCAECVVGDITFPALHPGEESGRYPDPLVANSFGCTDEPELSYMVPNGLTCENWTWMFKNRCNAPASINPNRAVWVENKFCQLSCYNHGNGYDGDNCADEYFGAHDDTHWPVRPTEAPTLPTVAPTPDPTPVPTPPTPVPTLAPTSAPHICTDIPSPLMKENGHDCTDQPRIFDYRCNAAAAINPDRDDWIKNKWCQLSCWEHGNGYEGDKCSKPTAWLVKSGPCTVDAQGCVRSPNYDQNTFSLYGPDESCEIEVKSPSPRIRVHDFNTEAGKDVLTVNGEPYSGLSSPNGVQPTGPIFWRSDGSFNQLGWRICPETKI